MQEVPSLAENTASEREKVVFYNDVTPGIAIVFTI